MAFVIALQTFSKLGLSFQPSGSPLLPPSMFAKEKIYFSAKACLTQVDHGARGSLVERSKRGVLLPVLRDGTKSSVAQREVQGHRTDGPLSLS